MRRVILGWLPLALFGSTAMMFSAVGRDPIRVPQDQPDIQRAIEEARPGDVILLDRGTYPGEVVVPADVRDITIRGVDRNAVIFDGDDVRENAIYVAGDGVTLENMTAHNFQGNGFYWQGVEGFVGRYLTVYNVGLYGIYAIESRGGLFEHSLVSAAADAAFYIGECNPCDTVLTDLTARLSAVGYSGTNASGNVIVRDSRWELNGAGILPNSYDVGIAEPPQRGATFSGNIVVGSGTVDVPVNTPLAGFRGIGIGIAGGSDDVVQNNTVQDSARYGIVVFATVDRENEWMPERNRVASNTVRGSGVADLALALGSGEGNCFEKNQHSSSLPTDLDGACGREVTGSQEVADELVLPPPELAEADPSLGHAPSYTDVEPPVSQPTSPVETVGGGWGPVSLGVVAIVAGAVLLTTRLSGLGPAALLVAGGILVGAGLLSILSEVIEKDREVSVRSMDSRDQSTPAESIPESTSVEASGRLDVVEVSTLDRLPGTQGETHEPKEGKAFLVVEARLQSVQGLAELSSEQAQIVFSDGTAQPAIGAGETKFCVECAIGVSSEGEAVLGFVFLIERDQMGDTFSFRYEGFPEIQVSASGDIRYP
jgi:hypothetical protein